MPTPSFIRAVPLTAAILVLLAGADASAKKRTFPAGSLIIPMDNCWQPSKLGGGTVAPAAPCENPEWSGGYTTPKLNVVFTNKPWNPPGLIAPPNPATMTYGVVWFLLRHGITVYWVVDPAKTKIDGTDLQIENTAGLPAHQLNRTNWKFDLNPLDPAVSGKMSFKGGPFVIHQKEAKKALEVMKQLATVPFFSGTDGRNYNADFKKPRIMEANMSFDADIAWVMGEPMRRLLVHNNGADAKKMSAYLDQSGLDFTGATLVDLDSDKCCANMEYPDCAVASCVLPRSRGEYLASGTIKPKPFMLNGGYVDPGGTHPLRGPGMIYDVLTDASSYRDRIPTQYKLDDGRLYYQEAWFPHWSGPTGMSGLVANGKLYYDEIVAYHKEGGAVISECLGVPTFEDPKVRAVTISNLITKFMSDKGVQRNPGVGKPSGTSASCTGCCDNASGCGASVCNTPCTNRTFYNPTQMTNLIMQTGDFYFLGVGGNTVSWAPYTSKDKLDKPVATNTNRYMEGRTDATAHLFDPAQGGYREGVKRMVFGCKSATGCTGLPGQENDWFTLYTDPNNPGYGPVIYLQGDTFDGKTDGIRLIMSSLFGLGYRVKETELARSSPILYDGNPATAGEELYQGTFKQSNALLNITAKETYDIASDAPDWVFPSVPGNFREYPASAIVGLKQDFRGKASWITKLPAWNARKVFTHFFCPEGLGAACEASNTAVVASDEPGPYYKMALPDLMLNLPEDKIKKFVDTGVLLDAVTLIEEVLRSRAGCKWVMSGTTCLLPADCTATGPCIPGKPTENIAPRLGGVDHSTPAVVGPSKYAGAATRPTIALFGSMTGQVHAIYVDGGAGHPGFVAPEKGSELWSFIPNNLLQKLRKNQAWVDGTLAVSDVYEDFDGDGLREWRTLAIGTEGAGGSYVFALDITDPSSMKSVQVLWEKKGDPTYRSFNPEGVDTTPNPSACALEDVDHAESAKQPTFEAGKPRSAHIMGSSSGPAVGQLRLGLRPVWMAAITGRNEPVSPESVKGSVGDPTGTTQGFLTVALDVKNGLPLYNCGDKWWHFFRYSNRSARWVGAGTPAWSGVPRLIDNVLPPMPTLGDRNQDGLVDTAFLPDLDGRLWEAAVTSTTFQSRWYKRDAKNQPIYPVPLYDVGTPTGPGAYPMQPWRPLLPIALFRTPATCPDGERDRLGLVLATGGADVADDPSRLTLVNGDSYFSETDDLIDTRGVGRLWKTKTTGACNVEPLPPDLEATCALSAPVGAAGTRVFSAPVVANGEIFLVTSEGDLATSAASVEKVGAGELVRVNICTAPGTVVATGVDVGKSSGGVGVGKSGVYIASTEGLSHIKGPPSGEATSATPEGGALSRLLYWVEGWIRK